MRHKFFLTPRGVLQHFGLTLSARSIWVASVLMVGLVVSMGAANAAPVSFGGVGGSSYTCDTEAPGGRSCTCSGPETGTDCQAMIDEVCGSPPPGRPSRSCSLPDGDFAGSCTCPWKSTIVAPNNITPQAEAPGTLVAPTEASPGIVSCAPLDPDWPGCVFTGLLHGGAGATMAPRDAAPAVRACLDIDDHRMRLSVPNGTLLQCCSPSLGYCVECPRDMNGECTAGPVSRNWANRIDGVVTTQPGNDDANDSDGDSSGGDDDDHRLRVD